MVAYTRVGMWFGWMLLGWGLLLGQVQAQSGIKVGGKRCIPDPSCKENAPVTFEDTLRNVRSRTWNFGDPVATNDTSSAVRTHYVYNNPGRYTVRINRRLQDGSTRTDTVTITIDTPPTAFQNWRNDTTICKGQVITLNPYPSGAPPGLRYKWYPKGDTTQTIQLDSSGCYSVEAISPSGCSYEDRINVKVCAEKPPQQGAKWYFGNGAGLDFSGGSPRPLNDGKLNTIEGSSSIANTKGQLLFYTDGLVIYDKDGTPMKSVNPADTARLQGNQRSTQSALIVPQPTCRGCEYLYRVYTTSEISGKKILSYSVVDMRGNQGKGEIVEKNTLVDTISTERLASVRNDRDTTYWVITHDFGSNKFKVTHITRAGAGEPKEYNIGLPHTTQQQGEGYMKIGPADTTRNGNRPLAVIVPGPPTNYVEIYTFNDVTGALTKGPTIDLGAAPPKAYGVEFSPDGSKVYVTLQGDSETASQIVSYDIRNPNPTVIAATKTVIDSTRSRQYGALQIASDGKIYVAIKDSRTVGVIDNPNGGLLAGGPTFDPNGVDLGGPTSQLGLPNLVVNFNEPSQSPGFTYADTCTGSPTVFTITPFCPPLKEQYTLTFGDRTAPVSGTATSYTHTYSQPGTYEVSLRTVVNRSDGSICKDTLITQTLTIVQTPDPIKLGPDIDSCKSSIVLDAKVDARLYLWIRNGRLLRGYNQRRLTVVFPTGRATTEEDFPPGQFVVIAANGGCYQADTINVVLSQPPAFSLGRDTSFCAGSSLTLTANGAGWTGFTWSNGSKTRSTTITQAGTYYVTVVDPKGCENRDTLVVEGLPKSPVAAFLNPPKGCGTSDGSIRLIVGSGGTYRYEWRRADGTPVGDSTAVLRNVPDGEYRVRVVSDRACTTDTTLKLLSNNGIEVKAEPSLATCRVPQSGSIKLTVVKGRPTTYSWINARGDTIGTGSGLNGVDGGLYRLVARDSGNCVFQLDSIRVLVDTSGFVRLGPDRSKCLGDTVQLSPLANGIPTDVYQWSNGERGRSIAISVSGTYRLTVRNPETGCVGTDEVAITFTPKPKVDAGPFQEVCANTPSLQLTGSTPAGGVWSGLGVTQSGQFTPVDSLAGKPVSLLYTVGQNGCEASDRKVIFVREAPVATLGSDTTLCPSPTYRLQVVAPAGATYAWSTGETTPTIHPIQSGTYSVMATVAGCTASDTIRITFNPVPAISLTKEIPFCVGDKGRAIIRTSGTQGLTYRWLHSGETTPTVTVDQIGRYAVQVTNELGCTLEDTAIVVDKCEPRVLVPDAFSPNGDGQNDKLDIFTAYISDFELKIFNRWGEVVFTSGDPDKKWDGTYRGIGYPPMVYAYTVSFKGLYYPERPKTVKRGSILLIR